MTASRPEPSLEGAPTIGIVEPARLGEAGRSPTVPFGVRRADGSIILATRLLRNLPGKRIAADARIVGQRVLAKLFIGDSSARHWARELKGIRALQDAGMPTPALVAAEALADGGHVIMTAFLDAAVSLAARWSTVAHLPAGTPQAVEILEPVFRLLGRMHRAGLTHEDLHLGNFLDCGGELVVVDGDAVRAHPQVPLDNAQSLRNLGMLVAQLPMDWERTLTPLLDAYRGGNPDAVLTAAALDQAISRARANRLADYMSKVRRNCTLFRVEQDSRRMTVVMREHADALAPVLADPDAWIASATLLKDGRSATVARIEIDGRPLVVKRYNIKSGTHALSRALRPSRAWHAWVGGHRLRLLGIPTPAPLAVIESRAGPLRGRAWLVTEHCEGVSLHRQFDGMHTQAPQAAEAEALRTLFDTLHRARISHGDLKAHNLFWDGERIALIDLDAMVQHRSRWAHARAWKKDRARLLRNWPADSLLHRWLDANLPPAL